MPSRPSHPCPVPGCPRLTTARYCVEHQHLEAEQRKVRDRARGSSNSRGYTSRWRRYAKAFIAQHPLCNYCRLIDRVAATECVDHATPVHGESDPLFWDPGNHRPACISCNSAKGTDDEPTFVARLRAQ